MDPNLGVHHVDPSHALILIEGIALAACNDIPAEPLRADTRLGAGVTWNDRAVTLIIARQPASKRLAAVSRILTYTSLAQYRAVVTAQEASGAQRPSAAAAVHAASAAVLEAFFPLDTVATETQLRADIASLTTAFDERFDIPAGEALGRTIGAAVIAQAAQDNYLTVSVGTPPAGAQYWRSSAAAIVRSLHGTKPFFLTSAAQLRPGTPPAVGSAAFNAALAEVRQISDTRTAEQTALAVLWNTSSGPITAGALNLKADSMMRVKNSDELSAARILAFANAAAFDAQIACWDAKVNYGYMRPSQADTAIKLAIALPNNSSFPSGHSCITGGLVGVLVDAFPADRVVLEKWIDDAGLSRVYGGIHFRFDVDAGRTIGPSAAALALKGSLKE